MIKHIAAALFAIVVFGACENNKEEKRERDSFNNFVIEGNIENGRGTVIYLGRIGQQTEILATDTADANGDFHLEGFAREKFIAIFNFDINKKIFLIVDTTEKIKLQVPAANYDEYTVSGSEESQLFRRLRDIEVRSGIALAAVRDKAEDIHPEDEVRINELRTEFEETNQRYVKEYSDSLKNVKAPLVKLYYHLVLQVPFDEEMKKELYEELKASGLQGELVQAYLRTYTAELATAIGQYAQEISLPDSNGNTISLSSLKGKIVLIDFWASWCGPCRQENPNVLRLYEMYKDRGFEIYGVSLDTDKYKWKQGIVEDGIHWIHVIDNQELPTSAARVYAVAAIPSTFLIDRDGKILAKNLRGKDLENKLREVLRQGVTIP